MKNAKQTLFAWALYDWANSAFATTVMAGFFPLFFKQFWAADLASTESTFVLGAGNSIASLLILLCAPFLGAVADLLGRLKMMLFSAAMIGIVGTATLFWIEQGNWLAAIMAYGIAVFGFMAANVFYDALLVSIVNESKRDFGSSLGYALGYLGGGILFAINVAMTLQPAWFGISSSTEAVQFSFLSVSVWWFLFSIPLFFAIKDQGCDKSCTFASVTLQSLQDIKVTAKAIFKNKTVAWFLLAYWFYIDGLDTIVRMAVDYGIALGLQQNSLITALIITQFVGFPATLLFGYISQRGNTITSLKMGIFIYALFVVWAYFIELEWEFYALAVGIGLVQGSVQALSRSYYASIIPADKAARYFGFYNMMGKSAVIIGPILIGFVTLISGNHRVGMLSILILFVVGGLLLHKASKVQAHEQLP